jgi:hypothetical protein
MKEAGPEVSLLVVSWNCRDLLAACLRSIVETVRAVTYEVIVVDNDSADGSAEMVRREFLGRPGFRLVENAENQGFARGNNQAYALSRGNVVALVNPDVRFADGALERLVRHVAEDPDAGVVSCRLVGDDGRSQAIHRRLPTLPLVFFVHTAAGRWVDHRLLGGSRGRRYRLGDRRWEGLAVVEQAAAALAVLRRSTIERVGGLFDERFPIYGNDVDLCRRVRDAGYQIQVRYDIAVRHHGSASLGQLAARRRARLQVEWLERYFAIHEPRWKGFVLRLLLSRGEGPQRP